MNEQNSQDTVQLSHEEQPLVGGDELTRQLMYPSQAAFRQARRRGTVPVRLIKVPKRRGWFADRREIETWRNGLTAEPVTQQARICQPPDAPGIDDVDFGRLLRHIRLAYGISQKALAIDARLDQAYLAGLEAGRRPPPRTPLLKRLIEGLNASTEEQHALSKAAQLTRLQRSLRELPPELREAIREILLHMPGMAPAFREAIVQLVRGLSRTDQMEAQMK